MWLRMSGLPPGKRWTVSTGLSASGGPGEGGGTGDLRVRPAGGERFVPGAAGSGEEPPRDLGGEGDQDGFPVHHYVLDDLIRTMRVEEARPPRHRPRRYRMSSVLIIDEVGFRPLNREEANRSSGW